MKVSGKKYKIYFAKINVFSVNFNVFLSHSGRLYFIIYLMFPLIPQRPKIASLSDGTLPFLFPYITPPPSKP